MVSIERLEYGSHKAKLFFDNGKTCGLSYVGFHGKNKLQELGEQGMNALLSDLEQALETDSDSALGEFFVTAGVENGMNLIAEICPTPFKKHWKQSCVYLCSKGLGHSFRKTLAFITKTNATLAHMESGTFIHELKSICECVSGIQEYSVPKMIVHGGVSVGFLGEKNNSCIYLINCTEVSACSNRGGKELTAEKVLELVLAIKEMIQKKTPIKAFTERWGGSFVLRIMSVACRKESLTYFLSIASKLIDERKEIEPRKILKSMNFSLNDHENQPYVNEILATLEKAKNESVERLINGNEQEVKCNSDLWTLYFIGGGVLRHRKLDFSQIKNKAFREETIEFLRDRFSLDESVAQLARYFYLIRDALNIIGNSGLDSVANVCFEHTDRIQAYMKQNNMAVNKISETMQVMGRFFVWANIDSQNDAGLLNPFWIKIPNKNRFLKTIEPAKQEAIDIVAEHLEELPEPVQIAFLLFAATLARANDICEIRLSDIKVQKDGSSTWQYRTKKNGRRMTQTLNAFLTDKILRYSEQNKGLQEEIGYDAVLVYTEMFLREGSCRMPRVLNAAAFRYQITKLLKKYTDKPILLTPRNIRAEGGRRLHTQGKSELEVAQILGNTPTTARKHYSNMTLRDEAEMYHSCFEIEERYIWGNSEQELPETNAENVALFGMCDSAKGCTNKLSCKNCGMLCLKEGGHLPWA